MTTLTVERARAAIDATTLTGAESAIVGIAAVVEARTSGGRRLDRATTSVPATASGNVATASPARTSHTDRSVAAPLDRDVRRAGSPPPVGPRLVPTLAPIPRLTAPTGPGHSRPPTLDDRVLARRRAALAAERAAASAEAAVGPVPTGDPTSVCCSLVLAAVESLAGIRAVAQLARWVTPEVYEALSTRAALTARARGAGAASRRPEVRRVRVCRIGDHVAEASVVVDDGRRVRAVAVRLESWRGSWRAVALEIG